MTEVRGLTIKQPYAGLVAAGVKTVENRSRSTQWRGLIAIHAGLRTDEDAYSYAHVRQALYKVGIPLGYGEIIAVARIEDCHQDAGCCRPWGQADRWHWVLTDVQRLSAPIPVRGKLGLWRLDAITAADVDMAVSK